MQNRGTHSVGGKDGRGCGRIPKKSREKGRSISSLSISHTTTRGRLPPKDESGKEEVSGGALQLDGANTTQRTRGGKRNLGS